MRTRSRSTPSGGSWRRLGQVTAGVLMVLGAITVAVPATSAARSGPSNPFGLAQGFNVVTRGDAFLGANESEGPIAIGGDLSFDGYNISIHDPGTYKVDPSDPFPTSLLVKGSIDFSSSVGEVRVLGGWLGVGDQKKGRAHQFNNTMVSVNEVATSPDAVPRAVVQGDPQPADTVFRQSSLDVEAIFSQWDALSNGLNQCASNVHLSPAGQPGEQWAPGGSDRHPHLDGRQTGQRVLNLTAVDLAGMDGINFSNGADPTADSPLIINVAGVPNPWIVPNVGSEQAHSPFTLWNFGELTEINIAGDSWRALNGTILAPNAKLTNTSNGNMNGGVFVEELHHVGSTGNEEIHHYPFRGVIEPCDEPTPTTSTTETTTTTEAPSTTTTAPETTTTTEAPSTTTTVPQTTTTEPDTPVTTAPETAMTTPPAVGPSTTERTPTPQSAEVLSGALTRGTTSGDSQVRSGSLARTGDETVNLAAGGIAALLGGAALLAVASRPRRIHN